MNLLHWLWQHRVPIEGWVFYRRRLVVHTQTEVSCVLFQEFSTGTASPFWLDACGSVQLTWAHVISSFIQTIIQPFPNARKPLPGGKHREGVWPQAMVSRRLDTVEWSQGELLGVGRYCAIFVLLFIWQTPGSNPRPAKICTITVQNIDHCATWPSGNHL